MRVSFFDASLEELYREGQTNDKRYKKYARNKKFMDGFLRAISVMENIDSCSSLNNFSFLHYEKLKYQYSGLSSVRIMNGKVERLIFRETNDGFEVVLITIDDTHYGNK